MWPESANTPKAKWLRRPDGDLHPSHSSRTQFLEDDPHQVEVADADTAAGQDGIAGRRGRGQRFHQGGLVVSDHAEVDAVPPLAAEEGQQGVTVGVADLAGGKRTAFRRKLVAGGQHADPWTGMRPHSEDALIGEHAQVGRSEHGSRRGDDVADGDIASGLADEVTGLQPTPDDDTCRPSGAVSVSSIMQTASAPEGTGHRS